MGPRPVPTTCGLCAELLRQERERPPLEGYDPRTKRVKARTKAIGRPANNQAKAGNSTVLFSRRAKKVTKAEAAEEARAVERFRSAKKKAEEA
jgi:hypothetical protein